MILILGRKEKYITKKPTYHKSYILSVKKSGENISSVLYLIWRYFCSSWHKTRSKYLHSFRVPIFGAQPVIAKENEKRFWMACFV